MDLLTVKIRQKALIVYFTNPGQIESCCNDIDFLEKNIWSRVKEGGGGGGMWEKTPLPKFVIGIINNISLQDNSPGKFLISSIYALVFVVQFPLGIYCG